MDNTALLTKTILLGEERTEISLEPCFWDALCDCARDRRMTTDQLISLVMEHHGSRGVAVCAVLRVFLILDSMNPSTSLTRKTTSWRPAKANGNPIAEDVGTPHNETHDPSAL